MNAILSYKNVEVIGARPFMLAERRQERGSSASSPLGGGGYSPRGGGFSPGGGGFGTGGGSSNGWGCGWVLIIAILCGLGYLIYRFFF
jgi:uncharacterized membrane protein YgcG